MNHDMGIYERLAGALDRLPNGFPRTLSNVEIPLLKKIFSLEEAALACQMGRTFEPAETIAERAKHLPEETRARLMKMAERGLVWVDQDLPRPGFRLAPFIIGIIEDQVLQTRDPELARLADRYMAEGGARGIMSPDPALHRVIPARGSVKSEWVLPYDDVRAILLTSKTFRARDCFCRTQQDLVGGRRCSYPIRNCLIFSSESSAHSSEHEISQKEALALLDEAEHIGLVHT
ncbi:MAG: hypothetical protein JRH07_03735, partial [Deltaproteobacteria bacterium]|nr:hypothetical protein [Deltaproteobacteria bacterium]